MKPSTIAIIMILLLMLMALARCSDLDKSSDQKKVDAIHLCIAKSGVTMYKGEIVKVLSVDRRETTLGYQEILNLKLPAGPMLQVDLLDGVKNGSLDAPVKIQP